MTRAETILLFSLMASPCMAALIIFKEILQ